MPRGLDDSSGRSDIYGTSFCKYGRNRDFGFGLRDSAMVANAEFLTKVCTLLPIAPTGTFVAPINGKQCLQNNYLNF